MGAGRRMARKQGPPEALSEEHFARLKRKAGLPVDAPVEASGNKRRRTGKNADAKPAGKKPAATAAKQMNGKKPAKEAKPVKTNGRSKPVVKTIMPGLEDDSDEELGDEFDLENADLSDDDEEAPAALGDDFLGSDSGSSVFDSDEEGGKGKHVFSEDEDESDAEEKLTAANIAGLSRKLDLQRAEEEAANAAELAESAMKTNIEGDRPHILDDDEDEDDIAGKPNAMLAPDLQLLRTRISENIRVLDDFANLSEEGRSRSEYTAQLLRDICSYYGYSEYLAEKLYNLFTPREAFAFFEANETARPVVIRTNTLRTHRRDLAQALINRGVTLEPVGKWSKVGLQIFESNVPLGATPEYLAGHYILQAASSFLPCMALDPQENERVLDMAAAPGGKTTYLAALMKNTGIIIANDPNKARAKGLIGNIHRLGARNVIVSNYDAREFPKPMGGFDRVLLDAPCSGTGVIAKDPSVKTNKTEMDFMQLPHTQKQLLLAAIDSVNHSSKSGGYVVYSTCSVTVEENEQVVQYALSRRPNVRLVDTGISFGREGFTSFMGKKFDASLRLTRRYYPHTYNVDGFYVAKFQKFGPTPPKTSAARDRAAAAADDADIIDKTPIPDEDSEDGDASGSRKKKDDFGGWDDEEDKEYMEKGRRNAMRRRGLDPRSNKKAAKKQSK
ncbi:25S rRNA (cytosine(2870)-C(5))-methyltransferase [Purpureocillium takamizusanense]|uniref:Nucleolar protein 2 n=1 Tax=Purpureocillium takamizusanense TaxID=2060973 RepID=A0A9Q8VCH6_9HYPO|nr:25S rRNA (cytosine(2870)-C(5))-methyltransferase [Purpureocillium takamizusanense]UNI20046.1 25S rRNA (cytosine(2870)-C(5))-methyltransferase [Purpureocillium takamizusanense]